ncbi:MAG: L-2-hydroxyglutarate oxidase [Bacteroidetes bacterium]|nr:L-2-hydroxyglutarate oxidase [Bacteroidota bacterium]MBS1739944.1 L-2-hydroxyglutarate oxidase [Bacteroidota bacterium]
MNSTYYDIIIIGGGIVGLATAYKITLQNPNKSILVLEKENEVAAHQTSHNSGVIHSGIYYKPGSYKAINCVSGRRELVEFAKQYQIPHDICGKIIVATQNSELAHLNKVFNNGKANDVEGIEMISAQQIKEIEPHCVGISGIWVPCTGIIDYGDVARKYVELIQAKNNNNKVLTSYEVVGFEKKGDTTDVITKKGTFNAKYIISCAGLQADRITHKDKVKTDSAIVGFRGDYYDLTEKGKTKVRNLIYPVPNPQFPFLGVHFTRMIKGGVECGPNAVFVFDREGYSKTAFSFKDTVEAFSFKGTWKFFAKHWKFGLDEYRGAFSKSFFLKRLRTLIPDLQADDIEPSRCGIRAMALSEQGNMLDDFKIEFKGNSMHVINSPSPAATASLAYGNEIATQAKTHFKFD